MEHRYRILNEQRLVVATFVAVVQDEEFIELYRALYADDRYALGMDEIADLRGVEKFAVSTEALHSVDQIVRRRYRGSDIGFRTVAIAPADLSFGVARIYEALVDDSPEQMFVTRDVKEALKWIGAEPSVLEPLDEH